MHPELAKKRNMRDLSYLSLPDGKKLKPGLFYRGAAVRKMGSDLQWQFSSLGIKTIVDLRTAVELQRKPDLCFPGISYVHVPILSEQTMGITHEKSVVGFSAPPDMPSLYAGMVTDPSSVEAIKRVLELIFDPNREGPILWHCTEGKDRCGIVSALFLLALGYDKDDVVADYTFNNPQSEKKGRLYSRLVKYVLFKPHMSQAVYKVMLAVPEYLESALHAMEEQCGSVSAFLGQRLGLTAEKIADFKRRYME
ncbi:MAG: tyrosine-protein phosphatase [Bacilli bacterium]|nr:tyrosine-protein phosphatase [Bacilli bacterium]